LGQVTLLQITPDAERHMGTCAALCYRSEGDPIRRLTHAVAKGHLSLLSHAHATIRVEGVSRVCSHQMVRHAHLRYLQESQRYVDQTDATAILPKSVAANPRACALVEEANTVYAALRADGVSREEARYILPQGGTTSMVISGTLQAWWDFLALRTAPDAQQEIRAVARSIRGLLAAQCPNLPWPGETA